MSFAFLEVVLGPFRSSRCLCVYYVFFTIEISLWLPNHHNTQFQQSLVSRNRTLTGHLRKHSGHGNLLDTSIAALRKELASPLSSWENVTECPRDEAPLIPRYSNISQNIKQDQSTVPLFLNYQH